MLDTSLLLEQTNLAQHLVVSSPAWIGWAVAVEAPVFAPPLDPFCTIDQGATLPIGPMKVPFGSSPILFGIILIPLEHIPPA